MIKNLEQSKYQAQLNEHKIELAKAKADKAIFVAEFNKERDEIACQLEHIDRQLAEYGEYMAKFQTVMMSDSSPDEKKRVMTEISSQYDVNGFLGLQERNEAINQRQEAFQQRSERFEDDVWELDHTIDWHQEEVSTLLEILEDLSNEPTI